MDQKCHSCNDCAKNLFLFTSFEWHYDANKSANQCISMAIDLIAPDERAEATDQIREKFNEPSWKSVGSHAPGRAE
jgi:hypothetical protein